MSLLAPVAPLIELFCSKWLTTSTDKGTLKLMSTEHRGIVVEALVREFKGGMRAVDGIDLEVRGRDLRLPRSERRREVDDRPHAHDAPAADRGPRAVAGFDIARQGADVRRRIGAALQEAALDPFLTGREHLAFRPGSMAFAAERARRGERVLERVGLAEPPTARWAAIRAA